jgi:secondary thiamine-phosphate synthase enzyme
MHWTQRTLTLDPHPRGVHLITDTVTGAVPELETCSQGMLHVFIQHTSASLALNEAASPDVRGDLERHLNKMVPEEQPYYQHTLEGPDDMPAHIKAVLIGPGLWLPVQDGALALGTWQGLYLCEHRNQGGPRTLMLTLMGPDA